MRSSFQVQQSSINLIHPPPGSSAKEPSAGISDLFHPKTPTASKERTANCALSKWEAANSPIERWAALREAERRGGTKLLVGQSHASSRPTKPNSRENRPEALCKLAKSLEAPYWRCSALCYCCVGKMETFMTRRNDTIIFHFQNIIKRQKRKFCIH